MKSDDLTFHRSKSIRGAAASLIGSEVPASMRVCGARRLYRYTVEMEEKSTRVARRKRSTLQVVRVTWRAARVGRDAAALALARGREARVVFNN